MRRLLQVSTTVGCAALALYVTVNAQGARTATQGVYTAAQATRGGMVYTEQCAFCHGDKLEGSGAMPPLAGASFAQNWQGKTVGDLFEKTYSTMPASAPGSLTEQQAADVVAYMLQVAQYPAGTAELAASAEPLKQITLDAAPAAAAAAPAPAGAPAGGGSLASGVYTAEQAKRGATLYAEQCAFCHGDNLEGSGAMPPLTGPGFAQNWQGKSLGDLFEKTHSTMPASAPGSLTEQQTADVLAYMLQVAQYPAGTTELPPSAEPLKGVVIEAK